MKTINLFGKNPNIPGDANLNYRYIYSIMLALTFVLMGLSGLMTLQSTSLVGIAVAEETRAFEGGDGSLEDPFQISNVNQLQDMSLNLSAHYVLINDIDASATIGWNSGEGFIPVGGGALPDWFVGSLDGQGYNITNLFINRTTDNVGLFGFMLGNEYLKNIGLIDINISGGNAVGGLVGYCNVEISNCFTTGVVFGTGSDIGGLVGSSNEISNCYSTGSVSGNKEVGGLVGSSNGDVAYCYSTGDVTGTSSIGGLVGTKWEYVRNCYSTGSVSGSSEVGGLVGFDMGGDVLNSFWDTETSGMATSNGGTGKTTAEMMTKETFTTAGWDFTSVWGIVDGDSYPFLLDFYQAPMVSFSNGETVETDEDSYFSGSFEFDISSNPAQNSIQSKSFETNASWITWDAVNDTAYGTPANDDVGSYFMALTIYDLVNSTTRNITISVLNTNDAPEIDLTYGNATEDSPFTIELLAHDIDPTEDIMNWTLESGPAWLELNTTTNTLNGTPLNSDVGPHDVNVSVSDGNGGSDWENFTIFVENVNDDPIIMTTPVGSTLQENLYSVFLNATDVDPVPLNLTWTLNTNAAWLDLIGTYLNGTPGNSDVGSYWVNLTVMDGNGGSNSLNYTLVVVDINDGPVWSVAPEDRNITEGEILFLDCLALDVDGDTITYSIDSTPASDLTINPTTGSIRWSSPEVGTYSVTLTATDGTLEAQHTFSIMVYAEGEEPVVTTDSDGDGMPDAWEETHGLDPDNASDAILDPDGDGISNLDEYKEGSDPNVDDSKETKKKGSIGTICGLISLILLILLVIIIIAVLVARSKKGKTDSDEE